MPYCYLHLKVPLHLTALLRKTRYNSTKQATTTLSGCAASLSLSPTACALRARGKRSPFRDAAKQESKGGSRVPPGCYSSKEKTYHRRLSHGARRADLSEESP